MACGVIGRMSQIQRFRKELLTSMLDMPIIIPIYNLAKTTKRLLKRFVGQLNARPCQGYATFTLRSCAPASSVVSRLTAEAAAILIALLPHLTPTLPPYWQRRPALRSAPSHHHWMLPGSLAYPIREFVRFTG